MAAKASSEPKINNAYFPSSFKAFKPIVNVIGAKNNNGRAINKYLDALKKEGLLLFMMEIVYGSSNITILLEKLFSK